ncbi:hypothetical protein GCM10025868_20560 [Angustibacter aerolatus]|uniref:Uncharacterized protein n=1 Tax=Angustibacter aerolatus TaxID=1162965 RepID=A0ABQ6JGZ0_9ACTN|nr:hypothetical protein GCM10025868_20560 [Angustibacter aerolatus]
MTAAWSPIDIPVRGSRLRGTSGRRPRAQPRQGPGPLADRPGPAQGEQGAPQVVVDGDGRVARAVDAARDAALDLAERDLVGDQHRGLEAGAAGLLDVVGGGPGREPRAQHRLPRQVEISAVLQHRSRCDLAHPLPGQPEARDQPVERGDQHVLVARLRVRAVGPGERDAVAPEHRGAAGVRGSAMVPPSDGGRCAEKVTGAGGAGAQGDRSPQGVVRGVRPTTSAH